MDNLCDSITHLLIVLFRIIPQHAQYASQEELGTLLELFPNIYDVPYSYLTLLLTLKIPSNLKSDYWGGDYCDSSMTHPLSVLLPQCLDNICIYHKKS